MRAAIVLAGGEARRLGGVDKALVSIGGVTMLDRVLSAAARHCDAVVVVGPERPTEVAGVSFTLEGLPGGGPVPAVGAGLAEAGDAAAVLVMATDLPLITAAHAGTLFAGLTDRVDAAAAADHRGEPNPLLAAYRTEVLRTTIEGLGAGDAAARMLPPATALVDLGEAGTLNVNRPEELERARRLLRPDP